MLGHPFRILGTCCCIPQGRLYHITFDQVVPLFENGENRVGGGCRIHLSWGVFVLRGRGGIQHGGQELAGPRPNGKLQLGSSVWEREMDLLI